MVFPQGCYSPEAVFALEQAGYLAAVNGDVCPFTVPSAFVLQDLLEVAVTKFSGFPLFGRRYTRHLADFAFDLFLGRPALAVEHHGYFKGGYGAFEAFIQQLNALDPRLEWTNLASICSQASLNKTAANGDIHVQFFTNRFTLYHSGRHAGTYVLYRQHQCESRPLRVTVDGRDWPCEREGTNLRMQLSMEPGQRAEIRILSNPPSVASLWKPSRAYDARVRARRLLCELRDNYLDTTEGWRFLLSVVPKCRFVTQLQRGRTI
jgi:hypothetical protein